jgi:hypothetical protein
LHRELIAHTVGCSATAGNPVDVEPRSAHPGQDAEFVQEVIEMPADAEL